MAARFGTNHGGGTHAISPGKRTTEALGPSRATCPEGTADSLYLSGLEGIAGGAFAVSGRRGALLEEAWQ